MPSESQQTRGYLLPEQIDGHDLICVRMKIPNDPDYKAAFYGALTELTKWWNWEKRGDNSGSEAAAYWRLLIYQYLRFADCDELAILGDCEMSQLRFCTKKNEDGSTINYYSVNDGCTWNEFEVCDDSWVVTPTDPVNPVDDPGDTPDLAGSFTNCQLMNSVIHNIVQDRMYQFVCTVTSCTTDLECANTQLTAWLRNYGMFTKTYQTAFLALIQKYADVGNTFCQFFDDDPNRIWNYILCEALPCMNGEITRTVLNCVGDAIDGYVSEINPASTAEATFKAFFKDFMHVYPLAVARQWIANVVPSSVSDDCTSCEEVGTTVCSDEFKTTFWGQPLEYTNNWLPLEAGSPANVYDCGDAKFTNRTIAAMYRSDNGYTYNEGASLKKAGFIQYSWGIDSYRLCQLYADITTYSGKTNTRFTVAWVREKGTGEWKCLASRYIPIGNYGSPILQWQGDILIDRMIIGGAVGGAQLNIQSIWMNYGLG